MRFIFIILLFCSLANAQQKAVNSHVFDSNGNPLQFVNIVSISGKNGTVTNEKGDFTIITEINDSLKFSYLSCETRTILVNDIKNDTIILLNSYKAINEIVI